MARRRSDKLRRFHQARWDEEIIYELSEPGQRGVLVPRAEPEVVAMVGDGITMATNNSHPLL